MTDRQTSIAGIILAAGRSSRMGEPKPLLDARGKTFLERAAGALGDGGCSPLIVVLRDNNGRAAAVARSVGAEIVINPDPDTGPIGSLRLALDALPADTSACVVLPADHPLVAADTVATVISTYVATGAPVVVPTYEGQRGHPALFASTTFSELRRPDLPEGARSVVRAHQDAVVLVPVSDPGTLVDVNTPDDYRRHFPNR